MLKWDEFARCAINWDGKPTGYLFGKVEGKQSDFHSHVTALTVSPTYRRLGIAGKLMDHLESVTQSIYPDAYFVDLYVRPTNKGAVQMYSARGYSIYRIVKDYYTSAIPDSRSTINALIDSGEDAFDMRKVMPFDTQCISLKHFKSGKITFDVRIDSPPVVTVDEIS